MNLFKLLIAVGISFSITFASYADDETISLNSKVNKKLSLDDCISIAINNSPYLMASKEDIEVSKAKLSEARSGYLPRLINRASYNYFNADEIFKIKLSDQMMDVLSQAAVNNTLEQRALALGINPKTGTAITANDIINQIAAAQGTTPTNAYQGMLSSVKQTAINNSDDIMRAPIYGNNMFRNDLSLQQPVFLWGKVYYTNKMAKSGIEISKSDYIETQNNAIYDVVERYNQVVLSKELVELADETVIKFETLKDMVERAFNAKVENVSKLDYLNVKTVLGLIKSKKYEADKNLALSKAGLKLAMGIDDNNTEIDTTEDKQTYEFIDADFDKSIDTAFKNRPEFSKLKNGIAAKEFEIKATKADNRPKVVIDSLLTVIADNKDYLEPDPIRFRFSVIAEIPLFDGFRTRAKVNQIKHEVAKLQQNNRKLKQGITLQVTEAIVSLDEAKKELISIEDATKTAIENTDMARNGFELDIVETKKVIDAQLLEAMIKLERLRSVYNYNIAKAKLKKVTSIIDTLIPVSNNAPATPGK